MLGDLLGPFRLLVPKLSLVIVVCAELRAIVMLCFCSLCMRMCETLFGKSIPELVLRPAYIEHHPLLKIRVCLEQYKEQKSY